MPAPSRPLPFLAALLSLTAPAACADGGGGATRWAVTDSAGVTLVEQTLDPDRSLTLDEVWRVGSLDGDEATQFFTPRDAVLGDEGRVYVLDSGNHRVKVFDVTDGSYLYGFGSEGEGPGEFQGMAYHMVAGGDRLVLQDVGRRIHLFQKDGTPVVTLATGTMIEPGSLVDSPFFDGTRWLASVTRYFDPEQGESIQTRPTVLRTLDLENAALGDTVGLAWQAGEERQTVGAAGWVVTPLFEQRALKWLDDRGRLHTVGRDGYRWEVRAPDGTFLRRVTNQDERVPVDPGDLERYRDYREQMCRERPNSECEDFLREAVPAILAQPLPEFMPTIYQLDGSDDGALLVLRSDLGWDVVDGFSSKTYDFFAPDGRFRGRFTRDPGFRVIAVDDEYILAIERDELDVESLVLYRWSEPDGA